MSLNPQLFVKKLSQNDQNIILRWANNKETRKNSIQKSFITKREHYIWFNQIIKEIDLNSAYICRNQNGIRVGIVRFSRQQKRFNNWEIHFTVSPSQRGKGLAFFIINKSLRKIFKKFPQSRISATVKKNNIKSLKTLLKLGFRIKEKKNKTIRLYIGKKIFTSIQND